MLSGVPECTWLTPKPPQTPHSQTAKPATQTLHDPETLEALPSTDGEALPKTLSREAVS